jgi:hypothetical protein
MLIVKWISFWFVLVTRIHMLTLCCVSASTLYKGINEIFVDPSDLAVFKARVCGNSLAGIAGSNPAGGMDVCLP